MENLKLIIVNENKQRVKKYMSLEECIELHSNALYKWSHSMLGSVGKLTNNVMEFEDFYNEGVICLMKVYNNYRAVNTFNTNLHKALDNLKIDLLRQMNTNKRKNDFREFSFDFPIEGGTFLKEIYGDFDKSFTDVEIEEDMKKVYENISLEEKKILEYLLYEENTKKNLAKELHISRPTLNDRIELLRSKLMEYLPSYNW